MLFFGCCLRLVLNFDGFQLLQYKIFPQLSIAVIQVEEVP